MTKPSMTPPRAAPILRPLRPLAASVLLGLLAACAAVPEPPALPPLPASWGVAGESARVNADWWKSFGDERLSGLIDEALRHNADMARALARVAEARALARVIDADRYPQLGIEAGATRARQSAATGLIPPGIPLLRTTDRVGLQAGYELDLWGRYANASAAGRADLAASQAEQASVQISVAAETARQYFALLALQAQLDTARRNVADQRGALRLQQLRADAGVISEFELRQLQAELAALEASLPTLVQQREQAETALALLLGRSPKEVFESALVFEAPKQVPATLVPAGLPSELLLRRPDLVRAQQRLAAADARIEVARSAAFPSLSLTGALGSESARLSDLFSGPAFVWQIGASVALGLFDGGRRSANTEAAQARRDQALADWQAALAQAFGEVRNALSAQAGSQAALVAQRERLAAQQRVLELAELRFANGIASQLDVLDARRSLYAAQSAYLGAEQARRNAAVDLFRALGGGWQAPAGS